MFSTHYEICITGANRNQPELLFNIDEVCNHWVLFPFLNVQLI